MVLMGYIVCIVYAFFLIYVIGPFVKNKTNVETSRKIIHIMLVGEWIFIDLFLKDTVHQIIIPVIFIALNALSYKFKLYKSVEREEANHLGTVYFAVAITAVMTIVYFNKEFYYPSGIAAVCLTVGDGFAALVGYNTKSKKFENCKSVNGTIACIAASVIGVWIFSVAYNVSVSISGILLIAILAGLLELTGKGLDNFSVSIGILFISWGMIYHNSSLFIGSIIASIIIFAIVYFSKAIDYYGSMLSMVIVFLFSFCGGTRGIVYLLLTYFTIFTVAVVKKKIKKKDHLSEKRKFIQILINGGLGTLFVILYGITGVSSYLTVCIIAIGGCFVDSISSDVGCFSTKKPVDIISRKSIEGGLSGGVSFLGTISSVIASAGIGIYAYIAGVSENAALLDVVLVAALCFAQTLLDSVLGSLIQSKYECGVCGRTVEKRNCCGAPAKLLSGWNFVDNNAVNAISSIIIVIISCAVFLR